MNVEVNLEKEFTALNGCLVCRSVKFYSSSSVYPKTKVKFRYPIVGIRTEKYKQVNLYTKRVGG